MNAIIGAIKENLQRIKIIFEPTVEVFSKDKKNTGDSKELTVSEFIQSFFPLSFDIKKGRIYNLTDSSNEIDCVVLAPNHPKLITPKREIIISEGVYAAIEVKPDISTLTKDSEFHRSLTQIQSVKRLKRVLAILPADSFFYPEEHLIPSVIFSNKSQDFFKTINYMKNLIKNNILSAFEIPDVIISLDAGIIFHSMHIEKTIFCEWVKKQSTIITGEKYIYLQTKDEEETLAIFLLLLLSFTPPEPLMNGFIIKKYIKAGISNGITFSVIKP